MGKRRRKREKQLTVTVMAGYSLVFLSPYNLP
jgi:hypothetical protein